jgi:hypothetical protein
MIDGSSVRSSVDMKGMNVEAATLCDARAGGTGNSFSVVTAISKASETNKKPWW